MKKQWHVDMQKITFRDEAREPQERMIEFCTKRRMALAILLLMRWEIRVYPLTAIMIVIGQELGICKFSGIGLKMSKR